MDPMRRRAFLALAFRPSARVATFEADITPPEGVRYASVWSSR